VINQIGVDTQNEVVKEEKKTAFWQQSLWTNHSWGKEKIFTNHPYRWTTVGQWII
jgi:hypothetical protein